MIHYSSHRDNNGMKEIKRITVMHTHFIFKRIQITSTLCNIVHNPSYCYCSAIYFYQSFSLFFFYPYYISVLYTYKRTHTHTPTHTYIHISVHCEVYRIVSHKNVQNNYYLIFICKYAYMVGIYIIV